MFHGSRTDLQGVIAAVAASVYILGSTLSLAIRGFSVQLGQFGLLSSEVVLVFAFIVSCIARPTIAKVLVLCLTTVSIVGFVGGQVGPGLEIFYLGFRKSILFLVAIIVGSEIRLQSRAFVANCIALVLVVICAYGIKQSFGFTEYDIRLMSLQAADVYTGQIGGQVRATSILSSGFHLGMAGVLLVAMGLTKVKNLLNRGIALLAGLGAAYVSITRTFMVLSLFVLVASLLPRSRRTFIGLIVAGAVAVMALELVGMGPVTGAMDLLLEDSRFTNRSSSYVQFASNLMRHPVALLFGFGVGSAGSTLGSEFGQAWSPWIEPHSIYLKYLYEFGVPLGVLAIGLICIFTLRGIHLGDGQGRTFGRMGLLAGLVVAVSGLVITSTEALPISAFAGLLVGISSREGAYQPLRAGNSAQVNRQSTLSQEGSARRDGNETYSR